MKFRDVEIDCRRAAEINNFYYSNNIYLNFLTEAKGKEYPAAFAKFLYDLLKDRGSREFT